MLGVAGQVEDVGAHCPHRSTPAQGRAGAARTAGEGDARTCVLDGACSEAAGGAGLLTWKAKIPEESAIGYLS